MKDSIYEANVGDSFYISSQLIIVPSIFYALELCVTLSETKDTDENFSYFSQKNIET